MKKYILLILTCALVTISCNKDEIDNLEKANLQLALEASELRRQISNLSLEIVSLKASKNQLTGVNSNLSSKVTELQNTISQLQSEYNTLLVENSELNEEYLDILTKLKDLELSIEIVSTENLIAWYPFNGNANDESGNGLDGQVNNAELTTDRFGNINSAYNFSDYQDIIIPSSEDQNLFPITISLWYNVSNLKVGEVANLFSKYVSASWNGYQLLVGDFSNVTNNYSTHNNGFGVTPWYLANMDDTIISYYGNPPFIQEFIEEEVWYHYVFVVDQYGGKIYVDGELIDEAPWNGTPNTISNDFIWKIGGKYEPARNWWYNGKIDDLAIWNRALTSQEIKSLYHR